MTTIQESAARQRFRDTRNTLAVILADLADIAQARGEVVLNGEAAEGLRRPERMPLAGILRQRAETISARTPFQVAVVGEFSRGKSTLINALLGRNILTTDVRPNTAVRTVIQYGKPERLRVQYMPGSGREPLVAESQNLERDLPHYTSDTAVEADLNFLIRGEQSSLAEQIQQVEIWCDSEFLQSREMVVIDTPGLGSVFPAHRAITYEIIPAVDATLFLIQADPGPGQSEITFLRFMREYVDQIFFVLTKTDVARNRQELEEMLEFVRRVVEVQADLQVENLYPVSAEAALEGRGEQSGFAEFLPALETFLVQSSGAARLRSPLYLAQTHLGRLSRAVERDRRAFDQTLEALRAELYRLQSEEKQIRSTRDKLLRLVDHRIGELVDMATSGMDDHLPIIIQKEVEDAVDELTLNELLAAGEPLQLVIKETVVSWLGKKEERFRSSAEQLQHRVEDELQEILDTIEASLMEVDYQVSVDVLTPDLSPRWWNLLGKSFGPPVLISAVGVIGAILGITVLTPTVALLSLVTGLAGLGFPAMTLKAKLQERTKETLLKPLPDNEVNGYEAIVEGFKQEGEYIPGVRAAVERAYREWADQLKHVVSSSINSNLNSRLEQLQRQIDKKESGQLDREQELARYDLQQAELRSLSGRLRQVEGIIEELSAGEAGQAEAVNEAETGEHSLRSESGPG